MTSIAKDTAVVVLREPDPDSLRQQLARGPVVIVSQRPALAGEVAALAEHPWGLVSPDAGEAVLQAALRAVAAGLTVLPPAIAPSIVRLDDHVSPDSSDDARLAPVERLTPRERDVLQRLAEGLSNRAIASALGISDHTVKFHLASIFGKLGAATRTEAVRIGLRQGLVTI
jgi:DNA-binding NarL/FixJ family response regulator